MSVANSLNLKMLNRNNKENSQRRAFLGGAFKLFSIYCFIFSKNGLPTPSLITFYENSSHFAAAENLKHSLQLYSKLHRVHAHLLTES